MKKLLAIFTALVFTAGMAIGQTNSATTTQDGDSLQATIIQVGGSDNTGVQAQYGLNNILGINQSGINNYANQVQDSRETGVYNPDNEAYIDQSGNRNIATQYQSGGSQRNLLEIDQSGNRNEAYQTQLGQGFEGTIDQIGNDNWASQLQEGNADYATILQGGSENWAYQHQSGKRNQATIDQSGDNNIARQLQYGSQNHALYGELHVIQAGNWNEAYQYQDNTETGSYGIITQNGSQNTAYQNQYGPGSNTATIVQSSNFNTAIQNQTGVGNIAEHTQD